MNLRKFNHIWKNRIITTLGFLILVMPMLGFPHSWSDKFYFLFGLVIVVLSSQLGRYLVYRDDVGAEPKPLEKTKRRQKSPAPTAALQDTHVARAVEDAATSAKSEWEHEEEKSL